MTERGSRGDRNEKRTNFAKILRRLGEMGVNQAWLARRLGVADKRITAWSKGTGEPSGAELWQISQMIDLPMEYLADPKATEPPPPLVTADEWQILDLKRALELEKDEALRRLSGKVKLTGKIVGLASRDLTPKGAPKLNSKRKAAR